jgi:hypothetical protein
MLKNTNSFINIEFKIKNILKNIMIYLLLVLLTNLI